MMKHLLLILCGIAWSAGLYAQSTDEDEQVLVFRHSGEVNFFYASELDSIVFSNYDADSIWHDETVSQLFYAKDTTLLVPIAEIDSVAFGSRNETVLNNSVHELLDDADFPWIIRTEGSTIYYRKDTPSHILPNAGDKLYYAGTSDLMPMGLSAKVVSVVALADEVAVTVEGVELTEIFDRLFYAGRVIMGAEGDEAGSRPRKAASDKDSDDLSESVPLNGFVDMGPLGALNLSGEVKIVGDFVINPFKKYYHAHIRGDTSIGFEWDIQAEGDARFDKKETLARIPLPPIAYGAIRPVVTTSLFLEGQAELSLKYSMSRNWVFEYEWTRKNGQDEARNEEPAGNDLQTHDEAKLEVLLNGEVYGGAELGMELNLPGDRAGIVFDLKAGPCLQGELGLGVLRDLREYKSDYDFKANLDLSLKIRAGISAYTRENLFLWGDKVERPLYTHDFTLFNHSLSLFPEYEKTRAVHEIARDDAEISAATEVKNEIPYPVETGFEIINEADEVVDSIFVEEPVLAKETKAQDFSTVLQMPAASDVNTLRIRPVFHYAGHTISAESVSVLHDGNVMPMTSYETNGVATFISGAFAIGTAKDDNTAYHIGNYLPVPVSIYESKVTQGDIAQGKYLSDNNALIGTWAGECNGEYVTITFNDDEDFSGTYTVGDTSRSFTYTINSPQSGDVRLLLDDAATLVITVISIDDAILKYRNKNNKQDYELSRQYPVM